MKQCNNFFSHTIKIVLAVCALFLFIGALASLGGLSADPARAAAGDNISGWAWSDNVGWISFNGDNYGVNVDDNSASPTYGAFSGFAWNDAIGWINFGPISGYPEAPENGATANLDTGAVTGWARACSVFQSGCTGSLKSDIARGGWDGWIKMSNVNLGAPDASVARTFSGYAWGSDVVGWISMSGASPSYAVVYGGTPVVVATPSITLTPESQSVESGGSAQIQWEVRNLADATCVATPSGWWNGTSPVGSDKENGTAIISSVTTAQTYTLDCGGIVGSASVDVNPFIESFTACNGASCGIAITILNSGTVEFRWDTANYETTYSCVLNGVTVNAVCFSGGVEVPCTQTETFTLPAETQFESHNRMLQCGASAKTVTINVRDQDFILQANPVDIKITSIGDIERGTGGVSSKAKITAIANITKPITLSVVNDPFSGYEHTYHFQLRPLDGEEPVPWATSGSGVLLADRYLVGIEFWIESSEPLPALSDTPITVKGDPNTPGSSGDDRTVEIHLNSRLFDPEYKEF